MSAPTDRGRRPWPRRTGATPTRWPTARRNLEAQRDLRLRVLVEKDAGLLNVYHIMQVNPQKWPAVNIAGAQAFAAYLLAPATQQRIATFGVARYGQPLFVPDAGQDETRLQP